MWAGFCLVCGSDIWTREGAYHVGVDDLEAFFPESNDHRCEPNRIRREEGEAAYEAWRQRKHAEHEAELLRRYPTWADAQRDAETKTMGWDEATRIEKLELARLTSGCFNPRVEGYSDADLLVWFLTGRERG